MTNPTGSWRYFRLAFAITAAGLCAACWLGIRYTGSVGGAVSFLLIAGLLAVLEISLSFDNAIVNANKLKHMTPKWQRRFLTWGILIAVFGMRIVFPLAVVAIAARVGPIAAIHMAATEPDAYAHLMHEAHLSIAAFGGTFLMMVALQYFIDEDKEVDWLSGVEHGLRRCASIRGLSYGLALLIVLIFALILPPGTRGEFQIAAVFGLVVYISVEAMSSLLDDGGNGAAARTTASGGLGAFLYLEVLDSSFSFDGVIGAFALTQNLFLIAIGLGIGAMFVRSMTIMLVEQQTLTQFRFLEHGAFYSILALSLIMFAQSTWHVPELVTGLIGAAIIGVSLISSIRFNRRMAPDGES